MENGTECEQINVYMASNVLKVKKTDHAVVTGSRPILGKELHDFSEISFLPNAPKFLDNFNTKVLQFFLSALFLCILVCVGHYLI